MHADLNIAVSSPTVDFRLCYRHLKLLLARLDIYILRELERRRRQRGAQEERDALDNYFASEMQIRALLWQPSGQVGEPEGGTVEQNFVGVLAEIDDQITALCDNVSQRGKALPFQYLADQFDLDPFEQDVLLACLAPALDPRYGKAYGFLAADPLQRQPSVHVILDLLAGPDLERLDRLSCFANQAPLIRHHLLAYLPEETPTVRLYAQPRPDDGLVSWLLGDYRPRTDLEHCLTLDDEPDGEPALLMLEQHQQLAEAAASDDIVALYGPDPLVQQTAAQIMAALAGRPLLVFDLDAAVDAGLSHGNAVGLALRDARLTGAVPFIIGWGTCLVEDTPPPDLVERLCEHPGHVIIGSRGKWTARGTGRTRRLRWLAFPVPQYAQRLQILRHFFTDVPPELAAGEVDPTAVAGQFSLTTEQWRDVVSSAVDSAVQAGQPLSQATLFAAAREHSSPRLTTLANKIRPRFGWEDLIVAEEEREILREIVDAIRHRPKVLEEWGVGRGLASSAGVTMLFSGPPGTGKTMAAEVMAGELGIDLYKIDLSGVVSKYIGETEKNLERIFDEAENSNAILFFDEADAIFGKRSEVSDSHDRHANIEVSYLLQRVETYDGVTILATNLRNNLDEAFMRRLDFAVDFLFPDVSQRIQIWESLFPNGVPRDPDLNFELLARQFKLASGSIRNVLVNAAYLAAAIGQVVTMAHLLHGTRRELQKMGRMTSEMDFVGSGSSN